MPAPTPAPTTDATDLLGLVLRHAAHRPARLALRDDEGSFTYQQLAEHVARTASGLSALGVGAGDRVALYLPNSAEFVVLALGCLWLGAAWVPLQPNGPPLRVAAVIEDCRPALVVAREEQGLALRDLGRPTATPGEVAAAASSSPPPRSADTERDAYLIYTSGTTGLPKGVRASQRAVCWETCRTAEALGLDETVRGLAVSAFNFDGSYGLVFPVLVAGGLLIVPRREDILFPKRFYQFVVDEAVTFTSFSPSYLRLVMRARQSVRLAGCQLRVLLLGGEECIAADVGKLWSVLPEVRVFNRYGPTETTIAVTTYPVTAEDVASGRVPIGAPHPGTEFFLLGEDGRLVHDDGVPGELFVGGEQLMHGYWGDDGLSREVLRDDVVPGRTLYKTGDLVYRDGAGRYLYVGRLDDVVKRHGVRISLAEVARAFWDVPGVTAVSCALVDISGAPGIAAFVEAPPETSVADLFVTAEARLPAAMLPDEIHIVGTVPMTPQGKVDRNQLLAASGRTAWEGRAP
jgi:amino acid adenylation domain-containing protein